MTPSLVVLFLMVLGVGIVALAIGRIDAWRRDTRRTDPERRDADIDDRKPVTDTVFAPTALTGSPLPQAAPSASPTDPFAHVTVQPEPRA